MDASPSERSEHSTSCFESPAELGNFVATQKHGRVLNHPSSSCIAMTDCARRFALLLVLSGCTNTIERVAPGPEPHAGAGAGAGAGAVASGGSGGSSGPAASGGNAGTSPGTGGSSTGGSAGTTGSAGTGGLPPLVLDDGRVVLRRLNRSEYNNSVRDLLGTSLRPADKLPEDEEVDGFDTVGEGLGFALQHLEILEQGATELIDELFALPAGDARRAAVLVCEPDASSESCSQEILSGFARRAFRRPVVEAEITKLLELIRTLQTAGNTHEDSLKAALRSILLSPNFIYMVEKSAPGNAALPVNDHELATRLSYFLWSSLPDAELSAAADAGVLTTDGAALTDVTTRMLSDSKAAALTENFVGQWLTLRRLALVVPDPRTFPDFPEGLLDSAVTESERFVAALIADNAPLEALLTADFTFVDSDLGEHYGLPGTFADFARVSTSDTPRVGILGQLSFLAQTSHPSHTSPTKRGAWVLEQLLCSPPDPPPADLMIEPLGEPDPNQTVRQKLELHQTVPACAGCHVVIDPIGFGLENFDAVGRYRSVENGVAVDSTGTLTIDSGGTVQEVQFSGARELASLLATDGRYASCLSQQLLTYAVGRSFHTPSGEAYADALVKVARAEGRPGFRDLITTVVQSEAFRTRRGE
jgi:hypothetical protein